MAVMRTANFANLVKPGLRKVTVETTRQVPKEFRQVFNVINGPNPGGEAGRNYFDDLQVAPLGTYVGKPEDETIQYDRIQEVNTVRYTPYTYALGARITHEMWEDELYGVMTKIYTLMARSGMHQMEVQAFRLLNGGFATTGGTGLTAAGFDSLALFSTAHVLKRGGTQANRASTDLDLGVTALENASDLMELLVDEAGMPDPKRLETIVHGPTLEWVAREIVESELKPYTGNNEINVFGDGTRKHMMVHYLTDSDSWFCTSAKADSDVNVWIREAPQFDAGDDFDTKGVKLSGLFRQAQGHGDYRGWFGSLGA
jgi:hypothetical protein